MVVSRCVLMQNELVQPSMSPSPPNAHVGVSQFECEELRRRSLALNNCTTVLTVCPHANRSDLQRSPRSRATLGVGNFAIACCDDHYNMLRHIQRFQ